MFGVLINRMDINTDHVEDDDIPEGVAIEQYMAKDAWHLVNRLGLVKPDGLLSPIAQSLIDQSPRTPDEVLAFQAQSPIERSRLGYFDVLAFQGTLADLIKEQYQGASGLPIVPLLQECARQLASSDSAYSPGLLLVEFQYLIELAHVDGSRTALQPGLMATHREEALRVIDLPPTEPDPEVMQFQNIVEHADAITEYYLRELIPDDGTSMNITELRSTAMLFTYAGLLDELYPIGPVQCLAVPQGE